MLTDFENYGKVTFDVKCLISNLKESVTMLSKKEYLALINHPSISWDFHRGDIKIFNFEGHHGFEYGGKIILV